MVEGHSVHRVASLHRQRLVGKVFTASSPNGRFRQGAEAIDGKIFSRIEAVGKNLFAFFGKSHEQIVVHVHFGMAGNWAVYSHGQEVPETTQTTRLRLEHSSLTADLSAMTVDWGTMDLYHKKRAKLGHDPLREDADPEELWSKVCVSKKSIGQLVMDQSYFAGPGNIYRAEILFKAGVHPDVSGKELQRHQFDVIWSHAVALLRRGFETGSILTVDQEEAIQLGNERLRRYIYNSRTCPRCHSSIKTWQIANRTCYACPKCQPKTTAVVTPVVTPEKDCVPFISHCAPESVAVRLLEDGPERLTVKELKAELIKLGIAFPSSARKAKLVQLLEMKQTTKPAAVKPSPRAPNESSFISSEAAAAEKAAAGESLAVEHVAELAPAQARRARAIVKQEESVSRVNKRRRVPSRNRR